MVIDTSFDFRTDSFGKDPDAYSATLRRYHKLLWSKPLPNGRMFDLSTEKAGFYLHHCSSMGEFLLTSDSVIPSFTRWKRLQSVISQFSAAENEAFRKISFTMGGMMIFPGNRVNGKQTINGARGFTRKISDRFDLTLECIRRHYDERCSPLSDVLQRYSNFFALFRNFQGYVDFFLLHDLIEKNTQSVRFFTEFCDFSTTAVPRNFEEYGIYRNRSIQFVQARNSRIRQYAIRHL